MIGAVLALFSAAASGISVILVRKHSAESNALNVSLIISWVGMVILWPLAIFLTDFATINLVGILVFAVSGVLTPGIVRLLYYSGLKKLGAPVNSSVFSVYPLYSVLLAVLLLGEMLSLENWVGVLLVILGGALVEISSREINSGVKYNRRNLIFPILGGLTLGVSSIIRKYALDIYNAPVLGVAVAYTFSFLPYAVMLMGSRSTRKDLSLKRDFRFFWVAGIGQAISWILSFYALSYERVSIITPLLSVEPLFVALFAYIYLKDLEQVSRKLVVSIILTFLGVVLVTVRLWI
jgi:drug/metabolite transporter (DMT)-like permease